MKVIIFIVLFSLTSCVTVHKANSSAPDNQSTAISNNDVVDVSLCNLIESPEKFEQRAIRVRGIYSYGFEWSNLYSSKCSSEKVILVETDKKKCEDAGQIDEMDFAGMGGRVVGVVAIGIFTKEEKYFGAMGKSDYVFRVKCFEKAKMLDRKNLSSDSPELKRKIEDFENSN